MEPKRRAKEPVTILDLFAIPAGTRAFRTALVHMSLNLTVTAAYLVNFLLRRSRDGPVPTGLITVSGVRVADEDTRSTGFNPTTPAKD